MPFVQNRGARIHYVVHGSETGAGGTVVLLQGLGLSSRFWFDVPQRLATIDGPNRQRRVIAIDNRGTGQSSRPRPPWTLGTMADDVAAVLDDANVKDDVIVVGISMGGMIAQHVALRHRARVRGLVLMATSPGFLANTLPEPLALYRLLSIPFGGKNASRNLARLLLPESKWHRAREIFREWPKALGTDPTPPATFAAHLFAASTHYVAPRLASIDCPVLVVAGEGDTLIPKSNAEALVKRLGNAELEVLPDTGHALFADDRDLVVRLVARLEKRLETGASTRSDVSSSTLSTES